VVRYSFSPVKTFERCTSATLGAFGSGTRERSGSYEIEQGKLNLRFVGGGGEVHSFAYSSANPNTMRIGGKDFQRVPGNTPLCD